MRHSGSQFHNALIFLRVLDEIFSTTTLPENPCRRLQIAPQWHDQAKKP